MIPEPTTVLCRTPTPGKQGTRIAAWKFEAISAAILEVVPGEGSGIEFADLSWLVGDRLAPEHRDRLGSLPWYVTTVKLEMEVRGDLIRGWGFGRQRLWRSGAAAQMMTSRATRKKTC
ncbi:MAG: hypothetical protein FJX72_10935 [Armatimonadetes bacterium]|nr:hypothetical protein [Armatimonadota bacterium]